MQWRVFRGQDRFHLRVLRVSDEGVARGGTDTSRIKIEVIDLWHASRAMDDEVPFKPRRAALCLGVDDERRSQSFDPRDHGTETYVNAQRSRAVDEQVDQAWIETVKRALPVEKDGRGGTRAGRHMCKLERDVTAADEDEPRRQRIEFQELVAGDEVLMAFKGEVSRLRARRDEDVPSFQHLSFDRNRGGSDKACAAMKRRDARLQKSIFAFAGHGSDEMALEAYELGPVNPKVLGAQALSAQAVHLIERLGRADWYLFRVAAAQRTGPPERT